MPKKPYKKRQYKKPYQKPRRVKIHRGMDLQLLLYRYEQYFAVFAGVAGVFALGFSVSILEDLSLLLRPFGTFLLLFSAFFAIRIFLRKKKLNAFYSVMELRKMDPLDFEFYTANLLKKFGFSTKVTASINDRGVDVVAYKDGKKYVVQCKRYAQHNRVDSPAMQQFVGSREIYKADKAMFVTTSSYTIEAQKIAKEQNIELIDESKLADMIRKKF